MTTILTPREVTKARFGPRDQKDPHSKEYAIQTIYALRRYAEMMQCDQALVAKELETIEQYEHWKILGYTSKKAMLAAELSDVGRLNVERVLAKPGPPIGSANAKKNKGLSENKGSITTFISRGASYQLARLKRDNPELAGKVLEGKLSANAAAIQAGFRRRQLQIDADDPQKAAEQVRRRCSKEFTRELIEALAPAGKRK